jgi:hypothetical protein
MDDFRKIMYGVLAAFVLMLVIWISFLYVSGCGFTVTCRQAQALVVRTPIPTLIPATLPVPERARAAAGFNKCQVAAVNLIGAWVTAGYPETSRFTFADVKGVLCSATFKKDVQPLFLENSLWYPGALACATCHNPNAAGVNANMDLSSYAGMLEGSRVSVPEGLDIFAGGDWEKSKLYEMLVIKKTMPFGRPPELPAEGPIVYAGQPVEGAPEAALTPVGTATLTP